MNIQTHILIVDGSPADVELVSGELSKGGRVYISKWARSKEEFLKALKEYPADIILCDYKMPGFDAPELLEIVKKDYPETPCIVVSGTIGEDVAVEMMKLGAIDYVMKDRLSRLVPAIGRALDYKKVAFEYKRAEERLRHSEEKFSKIFRLSPDSIVVTQLKDGIFIDANESFINQAGYALEELIGHSSLPGDLGIWGNAGERQKFIQKLQETGEVVDFEVLFRRKNGSVFNGLISSKIIEIEGQACTLSLIHDITERKIFLEALSKSEKWHRLIFEKMLNGYALHEIVLDDAGRPVDYIFLEVNPAFEKMLGVKADGLIGRRVTEVLSGIQDDPADWIGKYGKVAFGGGELKFENYSSSLDKWFSVSAFSPKKSQFVTMVEDITERKRFENELKRNEAFFRSYFELPLHGIAVTSPGKGWVQVNDQICSMLGYTREELLRMSWPEMTHPDDLAADVEQFELMLSGQIQQYRMDKRFIRKNGQVLWTSLAVGCVRKPNGTVDHVVALLQDITDRKKNEVESINRAKELEVFYQASMGREERIIELKEEVEKLKKELNK